MHAHNIYVEMHTNIKLFTNTMCNLSSLVALRKAGSLFHTHTHEYTYIHTHTERERETNIYIHM